MILTIFITLISICFILIFLSFYDDNHAELGIAGFIFLFLLSMTLIGNNLEVPHSTNATTSYEYYNATEPYNATPILLYERTSTLTTYEKYEDETGFLTTHRLGYFLAVASIAGFVGVITSLRRTEG